MGARQRVNRTLSFVILASGKVYMELREWLSRWRHLFVRPKNGM